MATDTTLSEHLAGLSVDRLIADVGGVLDALDAAEEQEALAATLAEISRQAQALGLSARHVWCRGREHLMWQLPASRPAFASGQRQALLLSACVEVERPHSPREQAQTGHSHGRAVARGGLMTGYGLAALSGVKGLIDSGLITGRDLVLSIEYRLATASSAATSADELAELAACAFALADCGGYSVHLDSGAFRPVPAAQKGALWLRLTARGQGGDPAQPRGRSAAARLCEVLVRVQAHDFPLRPCPAARALLQGTAEVRGGIGQNLTARGLLGAPTHAGVLRRLPEPERALIHALLHDTVSFSRIRAGQRPDVIADGAEAIIDCRLVPGRSTADMVAELRALVGDDMELTVLAERPAVAAPLHAPVLRMLCDGLERADPTARALPSLQLGSSDAIGWRQTAIPCYGFTPLQLPQGIDFGASWQHHGVDLPPGAWSWGVEVFVHTVARILVEG